MNIKAFSLSENNKLVPITSEEPSPEWLRDNVQRWIDVQAPVAEKLKELLAPFNIPQPILEGCLKPTDEPELVRYENIIYVEFPFVVTTNEARQEYISMILLSNTLITIHSEPIDSISRLQKSSEPNSIIPVPSISDLLYEIIFHLLEQNYRVFQYVREQISKLSKTMRENPDSVDLNDISDLNNLLDLIITVGEDQLISLDSSLATDSSKVNLGDERLDFKNLSQGISNALRILNRYDARVNDLNQQYMLNLQDRTNRRLKVLTIVSAIFLPLTLLAGIYGMNFQYMPELDDRYGYFLVLAIMALIAVTMLFYFYRRGWFK